MCLFTMPLFQRFCSAVFIVNFKQIPRFKLINFEHNCLLGWVKVILKCTGTRRHWYSTIKILMFYIEINSRPNWRLNNKRKIKITILKVERIKNLEAPTPQNGRRIVLSVSDHFVRLAEVGINICLVKKVLVKILTKTFEKTLVKEIIFPQAACYGFLKFPEQPFFRTPLHTHAYSSRAFFLLPTVRKNSSFISEDVNSQILDPI